MPSEGADTPTYECFISLNTLQPNSALSVRSGTSEELPEITLMGCHYIVHGQFHIAHRHPYIALHATCTGDSGSDLAQADQPAGHCESNHWELPSLLGFPVHGITLR